MAGSPTGPGAALAGHGVALTRGSLPVALQGLSGTEGTGQQGQGAAGSIHPGAKGTLTQPGPHGWGHRMSPGTRLSRVGHIRNASYATGAGGNDPWTAQGVCALWGWMR